MCIRDSYEDNVYTRYLREALNIQNEDVFEESEEQYTANVRMAIASRELPDVMGVEDRQTLVQLARKGMIADLSQAFEDCASDRLVEMLSLIHISGEAMRPVSVMIVLTALLCVVVAVIAYFVTSSLVSGRIEKLTERMREVEQGNLEVTVESEAKDEIGLLYRGFGKMLRRIRTLIDEVYVGKITQKEAEMRALQAQINPHFLYNTWLLYTSTYGDLMFEV